MIMIQDNIGEIKMSVFMPFKSPQLSHKHSWGWMELGFLVDVQAGSAKAEALALNLA